MEKGGDGIMKENILKALKDIVGEDYLLTKKELTASYLYDEVEEAYRPKANVDSIVIKPANSKNGKFP